MEQERHIILFLTKGYARYRKNLVDSAVDHLDPRYQLVLASISEKVDLWEVEWENLAKNDRRLTYRDFPVVGPLSFARALGQRASKLWRRSDPQAPRIEHLRPDIVAIQEFSWGMIKVAIFCKLAGIPCIVCTDLGQRSNWGTQFSMQTRLIHTAASWLTTGFVAHSAAAVEPLSANWRPHCFIPHSIDIRGNEPVHKTTAEELTVFLMVATFSPVKGHDLLLEAVSLLVGKGITSFKFRLVGTGDSSAFKELVRKRKLEAHFDFLGVLKGERLFDEFRNADAFVLSSRGDTFGVVVHEAASFGLPLLVSKFAGAASVLIQEGENGYTIDPYDASEFANRLEELIVHPEIREPFGRQSRKLSEQFCASNLGVQLADWIVNHHQTSKN